MPLESKPHRDALLASYTIGLKLKTLRNEKRLTLSRLGTETGLSTALLSKLESELMVPTLGTLAKICRVYGIGLGYFFSEPEHHSSAITRGANLLPNRRAQASIGTTPLHSPTASGKQVSRVLDIPSGATLALSQKGRRTELTAYILEGTLDVNGAGTEEMLSQGDFIVLDTEIAVFCTAADAACRVLTVNAR